MRRRKVESSTLSSVGYQIENEVLELEFSSGAVYQYFEVPAKVHEALWNAESKRKYFNLHIRDQYECVRLA